MVLGFFVAVFMPARLPHKPRTETEIVAALPEPAWHHWLPVTLGGLFFVYCLWALWSVIRTWRDPNAKVLRFSALLLLLFDFSIALSLMGCGFGPGN
jgi:hypothetical protein